MFDTITITTADHIDLKAEVFSGDQPDALVINPAIGVKRRLYHDFAAFLAKQGITVVLYNYRGMEDGLEALPANAVCDAESWGRLDQSAVIEWTQKTFPTDQLYVLGHSIGGQLPGFAHNLSAVDGLLLIAAQKGDKRLWSKAGYVKLFLLWHVLVPWMSRGPRFDASKLGLGSYPWPTAAAQQWASWGQQKDYLFNPKFNFDLQPWHQFNKPILSFGFSDDSMAPEAAINGLLAEYGRNVEGNNDQRHIEKHVIDPHNLNLESIGHFGFFKPSSKSLWQESVTWIKSNRTQIPQKR